MAFVVLLQSLARSLSPAQTPGTFASRYSRRVERARALVCTSFSSPSGAIEAAKCGFVFREQISVRRFTSEYVDEDEGTLNLDPVPLEVRSLSLSSLRPTLAARKQGLKFSLFVPSPSKPVRKRAKKTSYSSFFFLTEKALDRSTPLDDLSKKKKINNKKTVLPSKK